jgi:hypothetical protein
MIGVINSIMEKLKFDDDNVKDEILREIRSGSLIPIIGSGFTGGEILTNGRKVPNGREFKKMMIDEIIKKDQSLSFNCLSRK